MFSLRLSSLFFEQAYSSLFKAALLLLFTSALVPNRFVLESVVCCKESLLILAAVSSWQVSFSRNISDNSSTPSVESASCFAPN